MERQFLNITKPSANKASIEIDGTIGGLDLESWTRKNTGTDIRKQLKEISALNVDEIEVLITSLGGYVNDAFQIHDALKEHPAKVTTIVQGFCASAATVIACAGDTRIISPNALYLIHKSMTDVRAANENDLKEELEKHRTINDTILGIYKGVLKKDESELLALFNANNGKGKWITAEEALAFGFATDIQELENDKPAKSMARFLNHARDYFPALNQIINPNTNQNQPAMKKFLVAFAMLGALLSMKDDDEYDEKKGRQLTVDQLKSIEDTLKEFEALKAKNTGTETELADVKSKLATAESKIEAKDSEITNLTAERDNWKSKYENAPAPVQDVKGKDTKLDEESIADYVNNSPVYKKIFEENL